jgi:hypothetical protein
MRSTRARAAFALFCFAVLGAGCRYGYDPLAESGDADAAGAADGGPDGTPAPDAADSPDAAVADAAPPDAACNPTALLADDFAGPAPDPRWVAFGQASGATPALVNGRLRVTLPSSGVSMAYAGFVTAGHYDLTGKRLSVEVPTMVSTSTHAQAILQLDVTVGSSSYAAGFEQQNGVLHVYIHGAGPPVDGTLAYNAVTQRFWQLRESAGTLVFEVSADGTSFNPVLSSAAPFDVSHARIELSAGIFQIEFFPGMAEFDNLGGTVELGTACKAL